MGAAELIAIKRRIKSVTNTRKITKAMGVVATSKLKKLRDRLADIEAYHSKYSGIVEELVANYEECSTYLSGNGSTKKLYIVITSDMGLSGGFSLNVLNKAVSEINNEKENSVVIVIGQKGRSYFKKLRYETAAEYLEIPDMPGISEVTEITKKAMDMFNNAEVGEINVVYTKFLSTVKQEVQITKILPIELKSRNTSNNIIFEPSLAEIIENTMRPYISETILYCLVNSKTSEYSARMSAMNAATKSANDILDKLNSRYNRIRQSAITQEISEIVGGAEAQR